MQKIVPHLWYDTQAAEAASLYVSAFPDSRIVSRAVIEGTPSGDAETLTIELSGYRIMLISAGPYFKFNPSISFMVSCATVAETERLWAILREGGSELMPLGAYPFSERFGWCADRFGLSWQIMCNPGRSPGDHIMPALMFTEASAGKAEAAMRDYAALFPGSETAGVMRYPAGMSPEVEGTVQHAECILAGSRFSMADSAWPHGFAFNEAFSLVVRCADQAEIDRYWSALSAHPEAESCGWLKDRYGVSWQIVPEIMDELMASGDRDSMRRVTEAFLSMKKFDIAALRAAGSARRNA